MGKQWGDIYLCVPPTKMLGDLSPRPPYNRRPWSTCVLFRRSLRLELTSWAYPAININSCLQALTKDISTPAANIAPSALETIIFYCFMGYISSPTYYLLLLLI